MSSPDTSPRLHRPAAMDSGRRSSWWRRVTNKMKRKSSGMVTPRPTTPLHGATSSATGPERTAATRAITPTTIPAQRLSAALSDTATPEPALLAPISAAPLEFALEADPGAATETENESEQPLIPMWTSRTGITQDRARELFAKFGMEHRTQPSRSEPPSKIRRVEKPVRLRVHWTCHECNTQFGMEKVCHGCGHRRCMDCTRHPPKRIQAAIEETRRELEQQQNVPEPPAEAGRAVDEDVLQYQQEPSAPVMEQPQTIPTQEELGPKGSPRTLAAPVSGSLLEMSLELDENADDEGINNLQLSMYARPRAGVTRILEPKARRQCHKCHGTDCQNCGHERCESCPRHKRVLRETPSSAAAPMVQAVQRVYRKPRQRVRYTCENCHTLFMDSDRCFECGHERCENCHREPPKRSSLQHDLAVVRAVADRLAAYGQSSPRGIAASAG